jgi:histone demethylase JARID1
MQRQGEYVITFPKAYHGGFSLGFNCAEAVNFACADWLPWGQDAISKYRTFKHLAAFSLQKLLCNIAETPRTLSRMQASSQFAIVFRTIEIAKRKQGQFPHRYDAIDMLAARLFS